jgi:hypothetical protein
MRDAFKNTTPMQRLFLSPRLRLNYLRPNVFYKDHVMVPACKIPCYDTPLRHVESLKARLLILYIELVGQATHKRFISKSSRQHCSVQHNNSILKQLAGRRMRRTLTPYAYYLSA